VSSDCDDGYGEHNAYQRVASEAVVARRRSFPTVPDWRFHKGMAFTAIFFANGISIVYS
jgi:hypothetical protein